MIEADFNTEIINSLKWHGYYAYKIPDMPNAARRVIRFIPVKPCDVIACTPGGRFIGIEGKLIKKWQGMHVGMIRESQVNALDEMVKRNARAFIFVGVRIEAQKLKNIKKEISCVIFEWTKHRDNLLEGNYNVKNIRAKSVGVWIDSELTDQLTPAKTKKRLWDLKPLQNIIQDLNNKD